MVDEDSEIWEGRALPDSFPESVFQEIAPALDADPDVDGALPALTEDVAVISPDSQQFESSALLAGLDPQRAMVFDELFDTEGAPLDFSVLRPGEVYITRSGAEALQVESGSALSVALGPGMLTPINVRGVVDGSYVSAEGVDVVLMATLSSVQELLGRPGALSAILISNRGDVFGGIGLTDTVIERYQDHTLLTVILSARRISRLNIVRAIRDLPEPEMEGSRRGPLLRAAMVIILGVLIFVSAFEAAHLPFFGLGLSIIVLGIALAARAFGVSQRWALTGAGLFLVVYWLIPHSFLKSLKEDFTEDMSGFFVLGALLVTGAVLVTVNNAPIVLGLISKTIGRSRRYAPVVKSAVSYPLQSGYRTGLSLAMFAIVIFSVTVMATFVDVLDNLLDNQERIGGGYEVIGFVQADLNPVGDLRAAIEANPDLAFIERVDGVPSVGTFHTVYQSDARLASDSASASIAVDSSSY